MADEIDSMRRMVGDYHVIQTILWARAARRRLLEVKARAEGSPDELVDRYGELLLGLIALNSALSSANHAVHDHSPDLPKPRLPTRRQRSAVAALRHAAAHEVAAIHEEDHFLLRIETDCVIGIRGGRTHGLTFNEWSLIADELEGWARTTAQAV